MKRLVKKSIEQLVPYPPGKPIEELARELNINKNFIIKLASNENPLGPSPKAIEAIKEKLSELHRYPDGSSFYLRKKLADKTGISINQIIIGNGSNELIELIVKAFLSPNEEVIQAFPTFLVYEKIVNIAGARLISVPLKEFKIDLNAIYNSITPKTKIIFLNNPNNPTGQAIEKEELKDFLVSIPQDIIVVLDEAYIEFARENDKIAEGLELLGTYPLLFVMRTFSKAYGLAGLRIGYGFGSEELIDYMNRVRQPFNVNSLAQIAAVAALDDEEFIKKTVSVVNQGKKYLYTELDKLGLKYIPSVTNFFLIKVPGNAKDIYERLLRKGIIVRSMEAYNLPEYIRITVGLMEENKRFISALKEIL